MKATSSSTSTSCALSISFLLKTRCVFVGARAGAGEPLSPAGKNPGPGRGGGGRSHGPGIWAGRDAPRAPRWLRSEAPGRAGCRFLPAPGKRRSGRGGALTARKGALRCGHGGPDPRVPTARCPAQPRNREVPASRFNFWGPRRSPERAASAPTPGEEPGESPVGPFLWGSAAAFPGPGMNPPLESPPPSLPDPNPCPEAQHLLSLLPHPGSV